MIPFRTFGEALYAKINQKLYIRSSWGELYPLEKAPGTLRIVCFGGSTTYDSVNDKHYPLLLQTELREKLGRDNIEVINLGYPGYATPHALILLALDVISWKPDLAILSENVNDLSVGWFPGGFTFDYANKYGQPFYSIPDYGSLYSVANVLLGNFEFYWFIKERADRLRIKTKPLLHPLQRKSYGDEPSPAAKEVFERNLQSFITLAEANRICVVLGTQPLERDEAYQELADVIQGFKEYRGVVYYPLHSELVKHHQIFNRIIMEVAAKRGVLLVDSDRALGGQPIYFIDQVHYTKEGLTVLAHSYAEAILNLLGHDTRHRDPKKPDRGFGSKAR